MDAQDGEGLSFQDLARLLDDSHCFLEDGAEVLAFVGFDTETPRRLVDDTHMSSAAPRELLYGFYPFAVAWVDVAVVVEDRQAF